MPKYVEAHRMGDHRPVLFNLDHVAAVLSLVHGAEVWLTGDESTMTTDEGLDWWRRTIDSTFPD